VPVCFLIFFKQYIITRNLLQTVSSGCETYGCVKHLQIQIHAGMKLSPKIQE